MESLIETFHIDLKLLIAQAINFAVVVGVLYYFAAKPLAKIMEERSRKIARSLKEAEEIAAKLKQTDADYSAKIADARKEASLILARAQEQAEAKQEQALKKAKDEIGEIINEEKAKMQREKAAVLKEIRSEVASLVADSLEKVLEEKLDSAADRRLIEKVCRIKARY